MATSSVADRKCEQQRLHRRAEGVSTTISADDRRCARRPPCTAIAASRCHAALLHLVAVARCRSDVACLRASRRKPVLVPPSSCRRGGLAAHVFAPEHPKTLSTARLDGQTMRASLGGTRGREGGRPATATTAATTKVRHQSAATRQRAVMKASGSLFDGCRTDRP